MRDSQLPSCPAQEADSMIPLKEVRRCRCSQQPERKGSLNIHPGVRMEEQWMQTGLFVSSKLPPGTFSICFPAYQCRGFSHKLPLTVGCSPARAFGHSRLLNAAWQHGGNLTDTCRLEASWPLGAAASASALVTLAPRCILVKSNSEHLEQV
ncbi:hypothetical protein GOODEAATRI_001875 [Goodea atripinnis]|uniref:Uncharacterized protein n=1 Tax=Goodea atripinnis TaxID=208336 RepID=A0ABV0PAS5_9TELE